MLGMVKIVPRSCKLHNFAKTDPTSKADLSPSSGTRAGPFLRLSGDLKFARRRDYAR